MKSLEELKAIREKMQKQMDVRENNEDNIRVVVGMATCGIAAGARPVLAAFLEEVAKRERDGDPDGVHRRVPPGAHRGGVRAR